VRGVPESLTALPSTESQYLLCGQAEPLPTIDLGTLKPEMACYIAFSGPGSPKRVLEPNRHVREGGGRVTYCCIGAARVEDTLIAVLAFTDQGRTEQWYLHNTAASTVVLAEPLDENDLTEAERRSLAVLREYAPQIPNRG
jgi:hypothetical protein